MPNIATINGIDEDDIATHNGTTASTILSKNADTWEHLTTFSGGNQSATDLKTFFDTNFINSFAVNSPTAGGTLTLNGQIIPDVSVRDLLFSPSSIRTFGSSIRNQKLVFGQQKRLIFLTI